MNTIDMAKLVWTEKAASSQKFPQLRQLLEEYASPYNPGELVFPDIFFNAITDEQKAIRVHDFNHRISKNIKEIWNHSAFNVSHRSTLEIL